MTLAYLIDSPSPSNCVFVRGGRRPRGYETRERIESGGVSRCWIFDQETEREKEGEREGEIGTIRREEGFFMNTIIELYPSSDEPPRPPPPVPRLLMRNIVNVDYVYQESVFPVLLY